MTVSGFVAIVGRPNVGKSTLVNALVGEKIVITSSRPQTTRNVVRGILTVDDTQMVLVDTPGLHKPKTALGTRLNRLVYGTLTDADVVMFVLDATQKVGPGDRRIAERLKESGAKVVLVVNKVDKASHGAIADRLGEAADWDFDAYVPVSALKSDGLEPLFDEVKRRLPEGPFFFDPETTTDQPEALLISEIIREKFLNRLREELPHSLTVAIDELEHRENGTLVVSAKLLVERTSQKGIVIGKGGELIRDAGSAARKELESIFGVKVFLDLRVKVEKDWQRSEQMLDRLGF